MIDRWLQPLNSLILALVLVLGFSLDASLQEAKSGVRTALDNSDTTVAIELLLKEINSDYEAKRQKDLALVAPVIHVVPVGTFYNWMKKRGKLGGQNKVPRLSNTREYLDDILEMVKEHA